MFQQSTDQVVRFKRDLPPAHYTFKIESFSEMLKIFPGDTEPKYDSDVFECGGYKWYANLNALLVLMPISLML